MRIPEMTSPLRCKVTTGLEHFSGSEPAAAGAVPGANPLAFMEVNVVSCETAATGTNGINDSDMASVFVNYSVAALTLSKTVTRRLISSDMSTLGMGTVAP